MGIMTAADQPDMTFNCVTGYAAAFRSSFSDVIKRINMAVQSGQMCTSSPAVVFYLATADMIAFGNQVSDFIFYFILYEASNNVCRNHNVFHNNFFLTSLKE